MFRGTNGALATSKRMAGGGAGTEMGEPSKFPRGTLVRVVKGVLANYPGVVLDPNAVDASGRPLPPVACGYHWVMLTLNNSPFPAHFHEHEIASFSPATLKCSAPSR